MIRYPSTVPDNSEAQLAEFDAICARLAGFEGRLGFEYVDGWLTGLASGPTLPPWEQWMPLLCGDAFERAFADPEDAGHAQRALTARLSVLRQQLDPEALLDAPDLPRLSPSLAEWEPADEGARLPEPAAVWAMGVLDAMLALRPWWPTLTDADALALQEELLDQIDLLINLDGIEIPGAPDDGEDHATRLRRYWPEREPSRDDLIAAACMALQDLRVFWIDHAPRPEQRRVEPAPGRNDPCPCGSGKKYKKCHGLSA